MRNLQKWLQIGVGVKCTNRGDYLEHGYQDDWFSCGIVLPNTISHAVFGDKIWIQRNAAMDRIKWFLRLCGGDRDVKSQVSAPDFYYH